MEKIMRKLSQRKKENLEKVKNTTYSNLEDAIVLLKETATAKFVESAELHANLNIDPKYSDQQLRTTLILPKGTVKIKRIAVFIKDEKITPELKELAERL